MGSSNDTTVAKPTPAATLGNVTLQPTEVWRRVHQRGRLVPLLREAILEEFQLQQARQSGLTVAVEQLQKAADRFRQRHGLNTAAQTRQWLERAVLTVDDFEAVLERDLVVARWKQHFTEPRIAGHFAANLPRFAHAELRQIVVGSEEVARELLAQIHEEGRDFADLARQHSLDGPSRLAGGRLGLVPRYTFPAAAAEVIFAAKPAAVVGPVATDQGHVLFLVEAIKAPVLDETTAAVIREELFDAWMRDQLRNVKIDLSWLQS
jgi:parvulin-like peptidyl-prolyl isomerase